MPEPVAESEKRVGLIAGAGQFPLLFAKAAAEKGLAVYAVAYIQEADAVLADYVRAIEWLHLGQLKRLIRFFHRHGVQSAVLIGSIRKTRVFSDVKPDVKAISLLASLKHMHDDGILRTFARALEKEGIRVLPSTILLPELLAPDGCWTRRKPGRAERADIRLGWKLAKALGRLDIGQCVVVGGGAVLALEAIDGTDATILRGGRLGDGNAVAVKICKPNQDRRFDIPAVGVRTVESMQTAGVKVLAVESGKTVVFDRRAMVALADKCGIAIVALAEEENSIS